jgi:hypothetical protein
MKEELTKLNGEELFFYFTKKHTDEDYASIVGLLPYATMDLQKAYDILESVVKENKTLVAVYPGVPELMKGIDISKMELIGSIMDGGLYLSNEPYFKSV